MSPLRSGAFKDLLAEKHEDILHYLFNKVLHLQRGVDAANYISFVTAEKMETHYLLINP